MALQYMAIIHILKIATFLCATPDAEHRGILSIKNLISIVFTASIAIDLQPIDENITESSDATFTVQASGTTNIQYQWQEDQGSGFTDIINNATYLGSTSTALSITSASLSMSGNKYQCLVSGDNADDVTTSSTTLTVVVAALPTPTIMISLQPSGTSACDGASSSFEVMATGATGLTYQWQEDKGSGFMDIADNSTFSGTLLPTLSISVTNATMSGNKYQCVISGDNAVNVTSSPATLTVTSVTTTVTFESDVLMAPEGADAYQWFKQNVEIVGATGQSLPLIRPLMTGDFTVQVTKGGCFKISDPLLVTGMSDWQLEKPRIYPVPFNDGLSISQLLGSKNLVVELRDVMGKRHLQKYITIPKEAILLKTDKLSLGIYLLLIIENENVFSQRVVKH